MCEDVNVNHHHREGSMIKKNSLKDKVTQCTQRMSALSLNDVQYPRYEKLRNLLSSSKSFEDAVRVTNDRALRKFFIRATSPENTDEILWSLMMLIDMTLTDLDAARERRNARVRKNRKARIKNRHGTRKSQ